LYQVVYTFYDLPVTYQVARHNKVRLVLNFLNGKQTSGRLEAWKNCHLFIYLFFHVTHFIFYNVKVNVCFINPSPLQFKYVTLITSILTIFYFTEKKRDCFSHFVLSYYHIKKHIFNGKTEKRVATKLFKIFKLLSLATFTIYYILQWYLLLYGSFQFTIRENLLSIK
jgi:hypothetical protein